MSPNQFPSANDSVGDLKITHAKLIIMVCRAHADSRRHWVFPKVEKGILPEIHPRHIGETQRCGIPSLWETPSEPSKWWSVKDAI